MATIHSLPQELIQHTLKLAYPPGRDGSYRGLHQTSLIHSSWAAASQSLLTEVLRFSKYPRQSLAKFAETGPVGWRAKLVEFDRCPEHDIRVVLGKARAGGIKALKVQVATKHVFKGMFKFASLNKLDSFQLVVQKQPPTLSTTTITQVDFNPWPHGLHHLAIHSPLVIPPQLISASISTLTSFDLDWPRGNAHLVEAVQPSLIHITALTIRNTTKAVKFSVPKALTSLISSLPRLSSLTLIKLWPRQLVIILNRFTPPQQLTTLTSALWMPTKSLPGLGADDEDRAWGKWEAALQQCAKLSALRHLKHWCLTLHNAADPTSGLEISHDIYDAWPANSVAWTGFERVVARAGIELVLGPLDD